MFHCEAALFSDVTGKERIGCKRCDVSWECDELPIPCQVLERCTVGYVLEEVHLERIRQDEKFGGHAHDDNLSVADFVQRIEDYAAWVRANTTMGGKQGYDNARKRLIQVAAMAVAAVQSMSRPGSRSFPHEGAR